MDLFKKRALDEAQRRCNDALREQEEARAALDEARRSATSEKEARLSTEEEMDTLRTSLDEAERDRGRARESQARAEQMVGWLEGRQTDKKGALKKAEADRDAANRRTDAAVAELEKLKDRLDSEAPDVVEEAVVGTADNLNDEVSRFRGENESLRRKLIESKERLRVALRKAEHNRRAYVVTQMQLDLAEDRIHLLTKGKPRPVLGKGPQRDVRTDEKVVAEDVVGYEEPQPAGDGVQGDASDGAKRE